MKKLSHRHYQRVGAMGGKKRTANLRQRGELTAANRAAARARWGRRRLAGIIETITQEPTP